MYRDEVIDQIIKIASLSRQVGITGNDGLLLRIYQDIEPYINCIFLFAIKVFDAIL